MKHSDTTNTDDVVDADEFERVVAAVWNAIVAADIDPQLSHVELLFGNGARPWNGLDQRQVTYYLTSMRVSDLALLSFNACSRMCSNDFPQCFRVEYDENKADTDGNEQERASDSRSDDSVVQQRDKARIVRQCGRMFPKSEQGVRDAILLAHYVHVQSMAKERQQWATLVEYDAEGQYRLVTMWNDMNEWLPEQKEIERRLRRSRCTRSIAAGSGWMLLVQILVGFVILAFILTMIALITDAVKKNKRAKSKVMRNKRKKKIPV